MTENDVTSALNFCQLTLQELDSETGKVDQDTCVSTNNNGYDNLKCRGDISGTDYMSQHVATEEKKEIFDEKHPPDQKVGNVDVSGVVKNFVNDLLEKIGGQKYTSQTGLVYDVRMLRYCATGYHPERPNRIRSMYQKLCDQGLAALCALVEPRFATRDELVLKHTEEHIALVDSIKSKDFDDLEKLAYDYNSIYFHPAVSDAALLAAGCTVALMEDVILGNLVNGAAIVRPPGHHALTHCSMGFCHFNNVAVAAQVAIEKYNLSRVLIVDWDVHYGNGTHKMFEADPRVLFFSLHRYDNGGFWPHDSEANFTAVGVGEGEGYNIHVAWNEGMMGDTEYMLAFDKLLMPIANQYNPELVLVSCGFDSGCGDPLGGCNITPAGYANMTKKLMDLAGGRLVLVLEGGYNLDTISNSMAACVSTLLSQPVPKIEESELKHAGALSVKNTFLIMQKYWTALRKKNLVQYFDKVDDKIVIERRTTRSCPQT